MSVSRRPSANGSTLRPGSAAGAPRPPSTTRWCRCSAPGARLFPGRPRNSTWASPRARHVRLGRPAWCRCRPVRTARQRSNAVARGGNGAPRGTEAAPRVPRGRGCGRTRYAARERRSGDCRPHDEERDLTSLAAMRHLGQPMSDDEVPEQRDSSAPAVGTPGLIGLEGFGPAPTHARVRRRRIRTLLANIAGALLAWRPPAGAGPPVLQWNGVALRTARVVVADRAIDRPRRMPGTGVRHRNALRLSPADREARRGGGQEIARAPWCTFDSDTGPGCALCSSPGCVRGQGYRRPRTAGRNAPEARSGPRWRRTDSWWWHSRNSRTIRKARQLPDGSAHTGVPEATGRQTTTRTSRKLSRRPWSTTATPWGNDDELSGRRRSAWRLRSARLGGC